MIFGFCTFHFLFCRAVLLRVSGWWKERLTEKQLLALTSPVTITSLTTHHSQNTFYIYWKSAWSWCVRAQGTGGCLPSADQDNCLFCYNNKYIHWESRESEECLFICNFTPQWSWLSTNVSLSPNIECPIHYIYPVKVDHNIPCTMYFEGCKINVYIVFISTAVQSSAQVSERSSILKTYSYDPILENGGFNIILSTPILGKIHQICDVLNKWLFCKYQRNPVKEIFLMVILHTLHRIF